MNEETNSVTETEPGAVETEGTTEGTGTSEGTDITGADAVTPEPSGLTEEQGTEIVDLLTQMNESQTNTATVLAESGTDPAGMTMEQAQQMIDLLSSLDQSLVNVMYMVVAFLVYLVAKFVFNQISFFFSGL